MEIHRSARRHGVDDTDIHHAVEHALVVVDLDSDSDPPKLLVIGPDRAGNMLEVIALGLGRRPALGDSCDAPPQGYYGLLPEDR